MDIEQQVTSLELSKQLKEAGFIQEGLWWWCEWCDYTSNKIKYVILSEQRYLMSGRRQSYSDFWMKSLCVAPTVAELGEALPNYYVSYRTKNNTWICSEDFGPESTVIEQYGDTEAYARASMWLYLKKENI